MPGVARKNDQERGPRHCTQPKRKGAFFTVFANNIRMSGLGHSNNNHKILVPGDPPKCKNHNKDLVTASPNVFAEGIPIGRVGDRTGCSKVVRGSTTVFANGGGAGGFLKSGAAGGNRL